MATNKRRISRSRKETLLSPGETNWLYDRNDPGGNPWKSRHFMDEDDFKALWADNRDEVLKWYREHKPCTRPGPWWKRDAPQELVAGYDEEYQQLWPESYQLHGLQGHRLRIGGTGTPSFEVLNRAPDFHLGIPTGWITQWDADYYNGRSVDIHGNKTGNYTEGDFSGVAIDPDDPPLFESQAAYLQRHGLLEKTEVAYLRKHQELLEPEIYDGTPCQVFTKAQ